MAVSTRNWDHQRLQAGRSKSIALLMLWQGATAILDYNTIQSPLAQPRNSIFGHAFSAIIGVAITKLFMLSPNFEDLRWVAGPLACGLSSSVMGMTGTIHPPGGATALIAAIDPQVTQLGWMFIPLVLLGTSLMFICALILNNIQRRFPTYWWTPADVGRKSGDDIEIASPSKEPESIQRSVVSEKEKLAITITADHIVIPEGLGLTWEETELLEILRDRLRDHTDLRG
jgi:CBS-domain-containing membrane protein